MYLPEAGTTHSRIMERECSHHRGSFGNTSNVMHVTNDLAMVRWISYWVKCGGL